MQHEILYEGGIFTARTFGDAKLEGFIAFQAEILAHPEWVPGTPLIHDHSELNAGPLTVDDVRAVADHGERHRRAMGNGRLALVARRDLEFGLGRMWQVFVDGRWDITPEIVRTREEALAWLKMK